VVRVFAGVDVSVLGGHFLVELQLQYESLDCHEFEQPAVGKPDITMELFSVEKLAKVSVF
jgi:hypothetical protein